MSMNLNISTTKSVVAAAKCRVMTEAENFSENGEEKVRIVCEDTNDGGIID